MQFLLCVSDCLGQVPCTCELTADTQCSEKEALSCPFDRVQNRCSESWSDLPESHIQDSSGSESMELSSGLIPKGAGSIPCVSSLFLREWYQEENPIFKKRPL